MSNESGDTKIDTQEGIIVEASIEQLRRAAEKVLFEFDEYRYNIDGEVQSVEEPMEPGDYVVFEEKIKNSPAQVVVVTIIRGLWYLISTSQMPQGGYGSGRDAMRAAEAEEKRERIIKEFLRKEAGVQKIEDVCDWKPDLHAEAKEVLGIINKASRKWVH
ncbi:hypothetical protein EU528_11545 [Candidatus Thorarchaeota archaeon]|nr:MAG: hypothetical protein EU528_11545 [Candidatus Thorarchaeota archaeon]